jgi:hypothetical protein
MKSDKKKINKIYSQIDKIASVGKDNFLEYYQYVNDSVGKSDYDNLLQCLYLHYNIDIEKLHTVEDVKKKTWNQVRLLTNLTLSKKIKKFYDSKNVYQVSSNIYNNNNILIGQIVEIDDYNEETKYYIKNRQFSRIMKTRRNFLEVSKIGASQSVILNDYNYNISDDENMYKKYVTAINLLIS